MPETLRHKRWERTGRTFEVLDDLGQAIPNKFALTTRIGGRNVDLGDGTFAPYVLAGATLKHGDSECEFADGWQTIKRLGQTLVSKSRLYIQRDIAGVWTDVPHGVPTRNVIHDYPREGKCTAYLDFPDIQGYAQGSRLQVGIEVGGSDKEIFGFRMRSPVAGTFRLEWVLEIPEDVDLSWIESSTSKTDPTIIKIGARIGPVEIRWSNTEALFRGATVESDGLGGRILHLYLGPYTLDAQQWLVVYPDTIGPTSIAADGDDGAIDDGSSITLYASGESGGIGYFGEFDPNYYYWAFFRFQLPSAIASGSTITSAKITMVSGGSWQWDADDALKIYAENSSDAAQVASEQAHPTNGSAKRTLTTAVQRWPASGGLTWPAAGTSIESNTFTSVIQELIDDYSGLAQNAYIQLWITKDTLQDTAEEVGYADYAHTSYAPASITIVYTVGAATIEQEGFRPRNDDGTEATATWKANQDTNINLAADTAFRLRILLNATGDPASIGAQLEYRYKPSGGAFGSWNKVK